MRATPPILHPPHSVATPLASVAVPTKMLEVTDREPQNTLSPLPKRHKPAVVCKAENQRPTSLLEPPPAATGHSAIDFQGQGLLRQVLPNIAPSPPYCSRAVSMEGRQPSHEEVVHLPSREEMALMATNRGWEMQSWHSACVLGPLCADHAVRKTNAGSSSTDQNRILLVQRGKECSQPNSRTERQPLPVQPISLGGAKTGACDGDGDASGSKNTESGACGLLENPISLFHRLSFMPSKRKRSDEACSHD